MNARAAARMVLWVVVAAACKGGTGPAGPAGPEGPQPAGTVSSITAGDGLAGGTITTSGTVSIAPSGVVVSMIADGAVGPEKVGFPYAASASKGGAAADSVLLGGLTAAEFAASSHAHVAASVTDFDAAAVAAVTAAGIAGDLAVTGDVAVGGGVTAAGPVVAGGAVRVGTSAAACDAATAGAIRFSTIALAFEGCNGSAWQPLTPVPTPQTTYTRWGRSDCPGTATVVYSGYAAGKYYSHTGGGANLLCLTSAPGWGAYSDASNAGALLFGVEFQTGGSPTGLSGRHGYDATCAVCLAPRAVALMIPGTTICPAGWTTEYSGYLVAEHYTHSASEFVCVDASPDSAGNVASQYGALWYSTEGQCGSLPCPPYVQNRELACAVCTR